MTSQNTPPDDAPRDADTDEADDISTAYDAETDGDVSDATLDDDPVAMQARLEAAEASAAEHRDLYLRARAEADNVRRRAENEVANARKFAVERFANEMLAVRDSLELARNVELSQESGDGGLEQMREGLDLTLRMMDKAFAGFSIEEVAPAKGDRFDPERHQAMSAQISDEVPPNHVLVAIQRGYRIHERLLRPAMVIVARAPEADTAGESEGDTAS